MMLYLFTICVPILLPILISDFTLIGFTSYFTTQKDILCSRLPDLCNFLCGFSVVMLCAKTYLLTKAYREKGIKEMKRRLGTWTFRTCYICNVPCIISMGILQNNEPACLKDMNAIMIFSGLFFNMLQMVALQGFFNRIRRI